MLEFNHGLLYQCAKDKCHSYSVTSKEKNLRWPVYNTTGSHGCIYCSHEESTYLTDSISDLQIPLLRGSNKLEKMAYRLSWIAGKSGKHLFLKDIEDEKPPLLLQMVTDYGGLHFMYAIKK